VQTAQLDAFVVNKKSNACLAIRLFRPALLQPPTRQANIGCALLQPFCCLSLKSSTINKAKISCCLNQHQLVIHTQFASAWGTDATGQRAILKVVFYDGGQNIKNRGVFAAARLDDGPFFF
jgi:hypothetical protein